jgi:hypothetical protein
VDYRNGLVTRLLRGRGSAAAKRSNDGFHYRRTDAVAQNLNLVTPRAAQEDVSPVEARGEEGDGEDANRRCRRIRNRRLGPDYPDEPQYSCTNLSNLP